MHVCGAQVLRVGALRQRRDIIYMYFCLTPVLAGVRFSTTPPAASVSSGLAGHCGGGTAFDFDHCVTSC